MRGADRHAGGEGSGRKIPRRQDPRAVRVADVGEDQPRLRSGADQRRRPGIYAYREAESWRPRIVVGLNDISARKNIRRLGKDLMTVAIPFGMFLEMEEDVPGSFLEKAVWKSLAEE